MATVWEYDYISSGTVDLEKTKLKLNAMGSLGWEVCGWAGADKTIGFNGFVAILRRPVAGLADPADVSVVGWNPDPSGRHELRYWDGFRWSEHVTTSGEQGIDYPNVRRA